MLTMSFAIGTIIGDAGEYLYMLAIRLEGTLILLVALADSSFLTLPEVNDVLIVVLSAGKPWGRMLLNVLLTIVGSIIGCSLLYSVGRKGGSPLLKRTFSESAVQRAERFIARFGTLGLFVPSILPPPCPFKIFVLSAGVFRLGRLKFLTAVALGRTVRYLTWGILAVLYGEPVRAFVEVNARKVGVALFVTFVLVALLLIIVFIRRPGGGGDRE